MPNGVFGIYHSNRTVPVRIVENTLSPQREYLVAPLYHINPILTAH
jgi:hypothetical protein